MGYDGTPFEDGDMEQQPTTLLEHKVYNLSVLPALTNGSVTQHFATVKEGKLKYTQRGMKRKMLGVTCRDMKRVTWIRERGKNKSQGIFQTFNKKWNWAGHIIRLTENRWTKGVTVATKKLWKPRQADTHIEGKNWNTCRNKIQCINIRMKSKRSWERLCPAVDQ